MLARPLRAVLTVLKVMLVAFVTLSARVQHGLLRSKHWLVGHAPARSKHWFAVAAAWVVMAAAVSPKNWYW
jgi:hypothetical protein